MLRQLTLMALLFLVFTIGTPTVQAQSLSDAAFEATITQANQLVPNLGRPDRWEFQILLPSTDSAVMCPLVPGFKTDTTRQPFVVSLFYGETVYVLHAAADGSVIQPCDAKFGNIGMQPLPPLPQAADACTAAPGNGEFANVRLTPAVEAEQVATVTAQEVVLGRDEATTWYLVRSGWVAGTVVNVTGDCSLNVIPARDPNIVTFSSPVVAQAPTPADGSVIVTPVPLGTPVAEALPVPADFPCPANFAGYLAPRIQTGAITARVEAGGIPNSLRMLPTTESERVGQIQPGRRIDRVLAGPQCSDGYVWWEVEIDGARGWTAESSAEDDAYFLAPTAGNAVTAVPSAVPAVAALPQTAITLDNLPSLRAINTLPDVAVQAFAWGTDTQFALSTEDTLRELAILSPANPTLMTEGLTTQPFRALAYSRDDVLVSGDILGNITLPAQAVQVRAHESAVNTIAFGTDGSVMATGSGAESTPDETWTLRLWDFEGVRSGSSESRLRSIRFPYPVRDVAFSADGQHIAVIAERTGAEAGAALWIYDEGGLGSNVITLVLEDTDGQAFVEAVPAGSSGDFVYAQGGTLYSLDVTTGTERVLTRQEDVVLTDVAFSPAGGGSSPLMLVGMVPVVEAEAVPLLAFDYATVSETVAGTVIDTVAADAVAFSGTGRVVAVRDVPEGRVRFYGAQ